MAGVDGLVVGLVEHHYVRAEKRFTVRARRRSVGRRGGGWEVGREGCEFRGLLSAS